jgi:chemotaxis protein histidine kinase CheA
MENSYEFNTIAETNEEYSPESSQMMMSKGHYKKAASPLLALQPKGKAPLPQRNGNDKPVLRNKASLSQENKYNSKNTKYVVKEAQREEDEDSLGSFSASDEESEIDTLRLAQKNNYYEPEDKENNKYAAYMREMKNYKKSSSPDFKKQVAKDDSPSPTSKYLATKNRPLSSYANRSPNVKEEQPRALTRPSTAYGGKASNYGEQEVERPRTAAAPFKAVYKKSVPQFQREQKMFNYGEKKFTTVVKKSDIVKRFQAFNTSWKSTAFLKHNNTKGREGRKLNLSERISSSKPETMFYKYVPKCMY